MDERGGPLRAWQLENSSGEYLISTDIHLLDYEFINDAFASDDMFWAKRLPNEQLSVMISQSQTLGVYKVLPSEPKTADSPSSPRTPSPTVDARTKEHLQQIGMARLVTDQITTTFLTDVFIHPKHRQAGLGKWMIACCKDLISQMPAMRRALLVASPDVGRAFYARELGFWDATEESEHLVIMTKRGYDL